MSDLRELGERFLSNPCCRNFISKIIKTLQRKQRSKYRWNWRLRVKSLSCGVNLDVVKILNSHVYVWWWLLYVYVLKIKDWLTCEERFRGTWLQRLGRSSFTSTWAKRGGDVDGVFWSVKDRTSCTENLHLHHEEDIVKIMQVEGTKCIITWGPTGAKGRPNRAEMGLGRSAQAGRPSPVPASVRPTFPCTRRIFKPKALEAPPFAKERAIRTRRPSIS
jgi:hypothetical protein